MDNCCCNAYKFHHETNHFYCSACQQTVTQKAQGTDTSARMTTAAILSDKSCSPGFNGPFFCEAMETKIMVLFLHNFMDKNTIDLSSKTLLYSSLFILSMHNKSTKCFLLGCCVFWVWIPWKTRNMDQSESNTETNGQGVVHLHKSRFSEST